MHQALLTPHFDIEFDDSRLGSTVNDEVGPRMMGIND